MLPKLDDTTLALAFQLDSFLENPENKDVADKHLDTVTKQTIDCIVTSYDPPEDISRGNKPHTRRGRSASVGAEDDTEGVTEGSQITYPLAWNFGKGNKTGPFAETAADYRRRIRFFIDSEHFRSFLEKTPGLTSARTSPPSTPESANQPPLPETRKPKTVPSERPPQPVKPRVTKPDKQPVSKEPVASKRSDVPSDEPSNEPPRRRQPVMAANNVVTFSNKQFQ